MLKAKSLRNVEATLAAKRVVELKRDQRSGKSVSG